MTALSNTKGICETSIADLIEDGAELSYQIREFGDRLGYLAMLFNPTNNQQYILLASEYGRLSGQQITGPDSFHIFWSADDLLLFHRKMFPQHCILTLPLVPMPRPQFM